MTDRHKVELMEAMVALQQQIDEISRAVANIEAQLTPLQRQRDDLVAAREDAENSFRQLESKLYEVYSDQFGRVSPNSTQGAILGVMAARPGYQWTAPMIAQLTNLSVESIHTALSELTKRGHLVRLQRGVYALSPQHAR